MADLWLRLLWGQGKHTWASCLKLSLGASRVLVVFSFPSLASFSLTQFSRHLSCVTNRTMNLWCMAPRDASLFMLMFTGSCWTYQLYLCCVVVSFSVAVFRRNQSNKNNAPLSEPSSYRGQSRCRLSRLDVSRLERGAGKIWLVKQEVFAPVSVSQTEIFAEKHHCCTHINLSFVFSKPQSPTSQRSCWSPSTRTESVSSTRRQRFVFVC